jgi:hypothetical protein
MTPTEVETDSSLHLHLLHLESSGGDQVLSLDNDNRLTADDRRQELTIEWRRQDQCRLVHLFTATKSEIGAVLLGVRIGV